MLKIRIFAPLNSKKLFQFFAKILIGFQKATFLWQKKRK